MPSEPQPVPVRPRPRKAAPVEQPKANGGQALIQAPSNPTSGEQLAPWSLEAEQSVLGALLIDSAAIERVTGLIEPGSFYRATHGQLYDVMLRLHRSGSALDLVTLSAELRRTKRLDTVGGPAYLTSLMNAVPTALHVEDYARLVAMKALARRAIADAGRIAAMGYEDSNNPEELLTRLRSTVDGIVESWSAGATELSSTSLADLVPPQHPDAFLVGNLIRPGTTVMLAGPPGAAKSWVSRQLALCAGAGLDYFLERYAIGRQMNVLVVDEDNGPEEEYRRETRLLEHLGLTRERCASVRRVSLAGVQLDTEVWQRWLRGQIRQHDLDLLILDPVSEMHSGKELREDPSLRAVLAFLKRLKVDFPQLAVVIVHHTRKLPSNERQAHRGLEDVRGQWGQTPDVVAMMSPLADRRVKWEVFKRVPHSALILEQIAQGHLGEGSLRLVADETVMRDKAAETDEKVLTAIDAGARTAEEIHLGTRLSKSGVYNALTRMARAGVVSKRAPFERIEDPTDDELEPSE